MLSSSNLAPFPYDAPANPGIEGWSSNLVVQSRTLCAQLRNPLRNVRDDLELITLQLLRAILRLVYAVHDPREISLPKAAWQETSEKFVPERERRTS
jgi:hypothetical protein